MLFLCMICPARPKVAVIFPELSFFQNNSSPWSDKPYNRYRRPAPAVADARFVARPREQALAPLLKRAKGATHFLAQSGLLPISWSSDNGSHLFVHSVDEGSGGSSSIGTYLSQVAENSAGVRYPRELCGRSVLYSPFQRPQRSGLRFALELLAVQEFVANLAME